MEFEKRSDARRMMVIHIDETNSLIDDSYLVDMLRILYRAMANSVFFLAPIFTGTNACALRNLKVCIYTSPIFVHTHFSFLSGKNFLYNK